MCVGVRERERERERVCETERETETHYIKSYLKMKVRRRTFFAKKKRKECSLPANIAYLKITSLTLLFSISYLW